MVSDLPRLLRREEERQFRERRALMTAAGVFALGSGMLAAPRAAAADPPLGVVPSVANFAALRALPVEPDHVGQLFYVAGAWSAGDGGQGWFLCAKRDRAVDDNGMVVASKSASIVFQRVVEDATVHAKWFGAIADGSSHQLSSKFGSMPEAKAVFPHATSLSDEIDWCALQAMTNYVYARDMVEGGDHNWSQGDFVLSGGFVVNRTVTFNHVSMRIRTAAYGATMRFGRGRGNSWITYNGVPGTIDTPVYIFDCFLFDEFGRPPEGRAGNTTMSGGISVEVQGLVFRGNDAEMNVAAPADTHFVSALRIRKACFTKVHECTFAGSVWDGVRFTDAQLFCHVFDCNFYGVFRDAISIARVTGNFSTTTFFYNNEFGYVGRYAVLGDFSGSVEAKPLFHNNSYEFAFQSWFVKNPEWFVHGLVAGVCVINGGNMDMQSERFEGVTDQTPNYWADIHLIECNSALVADCNIRNIAMTAHLASRNRTQASVAFESAARYLDITDTRNYNVNTFRDYTSGNESFTLRRILNLSKIIVSDGRGISTSNVFALEDVFVAVLSIPTLAGSAARRVVPRTRAQPTLQLLNNCVLRNASVVDPLGVKFFATMDMQNGPSGSYRSMPGHTVFGAWQPRHAYAATLTDLGLHGFIIPATENGFFYQCIVAGTSSGLEPQWPRTIGAPVLDGGVTWRCAGRVAVRSDVGDGLAEMQEFGLRRRLGSAAPTRGYWQEGDRIVFPRGAILPGGHIGLVCTAAGTPGTWKPWGPIAK